MLPFALSGDSLCNCEAERGEENTERALAYPTSGFRSSNGDEFGKTAAPAYQNNSQ
jgi:hypothetical protein